MNHWNYFSLIQSLNDGIFLTRKHPQMGQNDEMWQVDQMEQSGQVGQW